MSTTDAEMRTREDLTEWCRTAGLTGEENKDEMETFAQKSNAVENTSEKKKHQHRGRNPDLLQKITQSSNPDAVRNMTPHSKATKHEQKGNGFFGCLRLSVHLVMFLLALSLAGAYIIRCIYHEYYIPVMTRASRTSKHLREEYTYYDRTCNVLDLTATPDNAGELVYESEDTAEDKMMTHGAIMFPEVLSQSLVSELRQFVVDKNAFVRGTEAEYPMSQGKNRISYGIEAAEHPAVVKALKAIHDNKQLQHLLEGLVGKNPALTEITAITSYNGCKPQVWHSDTKTSGYAAKFGRTYGHSYSFFIPLQNTTGSMGATDICPGTHYCTDEDLTGLCDEFKVGMHQVSGDGVWKAGDGALLNQQVSISSCFQIESLILIP
jgi:hypothetical protein